MELSLFQWIGIGLGTAIVLIPIARWFWKRFDMPSKRAIEILQRNAKEEEEIVMWAGIEAQVEAETSAKRESEMRQREKQEQGGQSLDEVESTDVWNKLGIDVPIQPVEREVAPPVIVEDSVEELQENPNEEIPESNEESNEVPEEPDWVLVEKMANLSEPIEGVPDAPDLKELSNVESPDSNEEVESEEMPPDWDVSW